MKMLYQFSASESFLHKVDPRSKMLFLIAFLVALWLLPLPYPPLMAVGMVILIWITAGIKPTEYMFFVLLMSPIMVAVIIIQAVTGGAPFQPITLFGTRLFSVSAGGLDTGIRVAFRLVAMGIAFLGFSMTTDPFHWGMSLYRTGLPYKAAFMFGFAMRFFPLLQEELSIIGNALKARASDTIGTSNPVKRIRGIGQLVIPLGLSAMGRSQTIALAMELRGYSIPEEMGTKRTLYRKVGFSGRDVLVWAAALAVLAGTFIKIMA